jgi:hypothetical protein
MKISLASVQGGEGAAGGLHGLGDERERLFDAAPFHRWVNETMA